jgi:hypothetical protein
MSIIELTREFVADAIRTESHLKPGNWVSRNEWSDCFGAESMAECTVCAVGSVMRHALSPTLHPSDIFYAAEAAAVPDPDGEAVLPCGGTMLAGMSRSDIFAQADEFVDVAPMTALSFVFESLDDIYDGNIDAIRKGTIEFVMNHFPDTIHVEINGYEAAADVRVLESGPESGADK